MRSNKALLLFAAPLQACAQSTTNQTKTTVNNTTTVLVKPITTITILEITTTTDVETSTAIPVPVLDKPPTKNCTEECAPVPQGLGPVAKCKFDTPGCFLEFPGFVQLARDAPTPQNFTRVFTDLHASMTGSNYLQYHELDSYDTAKCSWYCDQIAGCQSINIYFERQPTLNLGPKCRTAPHSTVIKCSLWGQGLHKTNARNTGATMWDFQVVIAGSNGYNREGVVVESLEFTSAGSSTSIWWPLLLGSMLLIRLFT
jgi:hypothetical protein